jgi:hypothetical protein
MFRVRCTANTLANTGLVSIPSIQKSQKQTGAETTENGNQSNGLGGNSGRLPPRTPNESQALSDRYEKCSNRRNIAIRSVWPPIEDR